MDEITNISFNYEATQQHATTSTSTTTLHHNLSSGSLKSKTADEDGLDDFDELAMLCSGQFKEAEVDLGKLIERQPVGFDDKDSDLYAADEPDPGNNSLLLTDTDYSIHLSI